MRFICIVFIFSYYSQSFCGNFFIGLSGNFSLNNYNFIEIESSLKDENHKIQDSRELILDSIEDLIKKSDEVWEIAKTKTNNKEKQLECKLKKSILLELKEIFLKNQNNEILDTHFLYSEEQIKSKLQNEIDLLSKWNLSSWQDIGLDALYRVPFGQIIGNYLTNQAYNTLRQGYYYLYDTASTQNENIKMMHSDIYENIKYQNNELNGYGEVISNNFDILESQINLNEKNLQNLEQSQNKQFSNVGNVLKDHNKALMEGSKITAEINANLEKSIQNIALSNNSPTVMKNFNQNIGSTLRGIGATQSKNLANMASIPLMGLKINDINLNTELNVSVDSVEALADNSLSLKKPMLSKLQSIPELENIIQSNPPIIQNKSLSDFVFSSILNFYSNQYFYLYTIYPLKSIYDNYTSQEHQNKYEKIFTNTLNDFLQTYHQKSYILQEISKKENSKKNFQIKRQLSSNLLSFSFFGGYATFINNFGFITEFGINVLGKKINDNNENKIEFKNNLGFYITEKVGYKFTNKTLTYINLGCSVNNTEIKYNDILDKTQNITSFILGGGNEFKTLQGKLGIFIEINNSIALNLIETKIGRVKPQSYQMKVGLRYYQIPNQKKYSKVPKLTKRRFIVN